MRKTYLGDGVYAEFDDKRPNTLKLTTSNGIVDTNTIYLEPETLALLDVYLVQKRSLQARRDS